MKTYKGFNKDMTCRGFKFEEGKTYTTDGDIKACNNGFHACEYPLDCFRYYEPSQSVYHEVEQDGDIDRDSDDTKIASRSIKIGAEINLVGIVKAAIEYTTSKADKTKGNHSRTANKANSATGDGSANSATGDGSANSATGDGSANSATGSRSANSATGDGSANSATGSRSANSATGDGSANSATGDRSANSATGSRSANSATGYGSANISTGTYCTNNSQGEANISVGWGYENKCKGIIGSYLVLSEWGEYDFNEHKYPFKGAVMIQIDGEKYKENTFYTLRRGEIVKLAPFIVGDIVKANELSNDEYSITNARHNYIGEVVWADDIGNIKVKSKNDDTEYEVNAKYFDLVRRNSVND